MQAGTTKQCSHLFALFAVFNDFQKNELFALLGANSVNKRTANTFFRSSVVPECRLLDEPGPKFLKIH